MKAKGGKIELEIKEELNKILIKLKNVPDMEGLRGVNCFNGDIEEYEEYTSNKFEDIKPFFDKDLEFNHDLAKLSILKSIVTDILKDKNETFGNLETAAFLSSGDY